MMRLTLLSILFVSIFLFVALAYPTDTPKTITLESVSNVYGPVEFSHRYHAEMAGDCASCHHHSAKGSTPACGECHESITVYRYKGAQRETGIGLKGAYHRQCMGCHTEMESGPVGCTDCHEKEVKK
ncbi:MAG: hypothetical protein A2Y65_11245 [Deltaproteobacteria bacterium RBG_13_52_11]|nr:MAG: hypothetical protein A2Y65_11245 [Deltaproteobacteria bacterium RBG_13_52_11]